MSNGQNRRTFLFTTGFAGAALLFGSSSANALSSGLGNYAIFATIEYHDDDADTLLTILQGHRERVLKTDKGALQFDILKDNRELGKMHLYEVYEDRNAFLAHWRGPTIQRVVQELKPIKHKMTAIHTTRA